MTAFRRFYGANPLHLVAGLASLTVIGLAFQGIFREPAYDLKPILIWFGAAAVAHDMIVLPFYVAFDQIGRLAKINWWAYVRVPLMLSALLLVIFGPEILNVGDLTFHVASGQHQHVYLGRYLIIVAVLFAGSAATFVVNRLP